MPARRCERNAVAKLHRNRHNVVHRRATRCNTGCAAPSCNIEHQPSCNMDGCTLQPSASQHCQVMQHENPAAICLITGTGLLHHLCATNTDR
jgi:hypothetical protein